MLNALEITQKPLVNMREMLVKQKVAEKHHLEAATHPDSIRSIKKFFKAFDKEIELIETKIKKLIETDKSLKNNNNSSPRSQVLEILLLPRCWLYYQN